MLRALSNQDMPWEKVHVVQVDERVAPSGHQDRNLTHLYDSLLKQVRLRWITFMPCLWKPLIWKLPPHNMPRTPRDCRLAAGARPGPPRSRSDGHTASLVPGDSVLDVTDTDVALTGLYQEGAG